MARAIVVCLFSELKALLNCCWPSKLTVGGTIRSPRPGFMSCSVVDLLLLAFTDTPLFNGTRVLDLIISCEPSIRPGNGGPTLEAGSHPDNSAASGAREPL